MSQQVSGEGVPVLVSVIDDHPDLCYGVLARLPLVSLSFAAGVMAATVAEFLALDEAAERPSDVVLLDLTLKDGSTPMQNVGQLKSHGFAVVIYTGEERPERLQGTLGIGADALIRKEEAEQLEEALRAVMSGDQTWVSPLMANVELVTSGPHLPPSELRALRLYATGITAQQIASSMGCSVETVKTYLKRVKDRYRVYGDDVYTRTDLLKVAIRDQHVSQDWWWAGGGG
jgi:DNA-binding NarL/FixJ family response regulator